MRESVMCFKSVRDYDMDTSLTDASRYIRLTMEILEAMETHDGKAMQKAEACLMVGTFKGVTLDASTEQVNKLQFIQAVIDNLSTRLPDSNRTNWGRRRVKQRPRASSAMTSKQMFMVSGCRSRRHQGHFPLDLESQCSNEDSVLYE
ncbi:hypothetical protein AAFF_G00197040 [Aldrovandia affinis]|uniref:Uncharacterized protein n=1 Tax=Aldrovandia affinis TaxID=143900 RepID=A0AAD7W5D4_9TELE|nr:hypothetical protein AAFF_G00197040 [Aldrovandia affinis]